MLLNQPLSTITEEEENLTLDKERLSFILETANDAFISLDSDGIVREWNQQAYNMFGLTKEEAIGQSMTSVIIPPQHLKELQLEIKNDLGFVKKPVIHRQIEVQGIHTSGYSFPAEMSLSVTKQHQSYSFNAFIRDISQRKEAESALEERTIELEKSNQELERFAYIASHDLKEPLRMISSYTQILQKRYQGKLDHDANDFIHYIVDGVKRMQSMINGLLEYSRVGRSHDLNQKFSALEVIEDACKNLEFQINETKGSILFRLDSKIQLQGDRILFIQLFQNLISNALKFCITKKPQIEISFYEDRIKQKLLFWVKDNGIGIKPEHQNQIFNLFQRLHERNKIEGTGIGLSLCKKIIQIHRGRIWVVSQYGVGSTFFIELPYLE